MIKRILNFLHLDSERNFDRFINAARKSFDKSMFKGWGATYVGGTMVRFDKTEDNLERTCIEFGQEIGHQLYEEIKNRCDYDEITHLGIDKVHYSTDVDYDWLESDLYEDVKEE